jgi:hypothetical protein
MRRPAGARARQPRVTSPAGRRIPVAACSRTFAEGSERFAVLVGGAQVLGSHDRDARPASPADVTVLAGERDHAAAPSGDVLIRPAERIAPLAAEPEVVA